MGEHLLKLLMGIKLIFHLTFICSKDKGRILFQSCFIMKRSDKDFSEIGRREKTKETAVR